MTEMDKSLSSDDIVDLGEKQHKAGLLQEAESCYRKALEIDPGHPGALYFLANIAYDDGRLPLATQLIDELLRDEPNDAEAWHLLGMIALREENFPRAVVCLKKAVALQPAYAQAHYSLGDVLGRQGDFNAAIRHYQQALIIDPENADTYRDLCGQFWMQGSLREAEHAAQRAVALRPNDPRLHNDLGQVLHRAGRLAEAVDCLQRAIALDPNWAVAHSSFLATSQYLPNYSRKKIFYDHVAFGERFEVPSRANIFNYSKPLNPNKRLRVGFVSADLYKHPVGFFLLGVLGELRNLDGLDIAVYSVGTKKEDAVTDRLRAVAHSWSTVSKSSDDELEKHIRNDNIDILVDLSGHTTENRLLVFARKPAPIQVTWLGYWQTTGLQAMNYILCDRYCIRDDEEKYFVEKPWYLPHTRLCFTLPDENVAVAPLPALSNGQVTFGCFNNLSKMTDRVVAVWSRILKSIQNSRLFLEWASLAEPAIRENVIARFAAEGVSADRLVLESASPLRDYFWAYNHVDIALDPFPFSGGTTSIQGIWMGVPMVTLLGDSIISRQGEIILHNLGLHDWIAKG